MRLLFNDQEIRRKMDHKITIIPTSQITHQHLALYLTADPEEAVVNKYLPCCATFELRIAHELAGVILLEPLDDQQIEIKNIAVAAHFQGHGYGKALVQFAKRYARLHQATSLVVGTGSTSVEPLLLYQKCGFRPYQIDQDFFTRNYHQPIYEHGIRLRDMIRLVVHLQ